MARGLFRIVCALLLASSTVMLFSTPRRTSVTRVAHEIHHKVSYGTEELLSSATEWYEQADLPFAPGLAYLKGSGSSPDSKSPPSSSASPNTPASSSKPHSPPPVSQKQKDSGLGHLSSLCRDTPWNPNITLHCHSSCGADQLSLCGGLAEARNRIQTCIRLAIDAGAGGALIIPPIVMKGADEDKSGGQAFATTTTTSNKNGHSVCPGNLFDFAGLQRTMGNWCPGLKIRTSAPCRSDNDATTPSGKQALAEAVREEEEDPEQLLLQGKKGRRVKTLNLSSRWRPPYCLTAPGWSSTVGSLSAALSLSSSFRGAVLRFLADAGLAAEPVVLRLGDPYLAWDYARSREAATLRRDLFAAVRHNASLGALGRAVGESMDGDGGGGTSGCASAVAGATGQRRAASRRRSRAAAATTPSKGDGDSDIKTVYVSGGSPTAVQKFREMLQPLDYKVYDKWTLLEPASEGNGSGNETLLAQIKALDVDQRDVVEYEVLVRARYWMGVSTSPMSALLAYARGEGSRKSSQDAAGDTKDRDADLDWFERYIYPSSGKSVALDGGSGQRTYEREMEARGIGSRSCSSSVAMM
ncbi:uncharacterized protein PG998_003046 [Apiospora kogelbergensis]|uniref:uncharacterized protein n=1 Tax=Apiospora kogelbergensis TaxID=1337665 RepID=UPI0031303C6B